MTGLRSPIVLFCSERSGSNLITKMLDANPTICGPGACHLYRLMAEFSCKFGSDLDSMRSAVLDIFRLKSSVWLIDRFSDDELLTILGKCDSPAEMVASIYSAELQESQKECIVLKENSVYRYLEFVNITAKRPKFLYMVRDPRGMAASWKDAALIRGGVQRAVRTWLSDQTGYIRALSLMPKNTQIAFLRYEDLLVAPEFCLRKACSELDVPYSEQMLDFQNYSKSASADASRSPMWENLNSRLKPELASRYSASLTSNEHAYIFLKCSALMRQFGYLNDDAKLEGFGDFCSQRQLEAHIEETEPHEKASYKKIDSAIRHRFEGWSSYYKMLVERPIVFERVG